MTLNITDVVCAQYSKEGRVLFCVLCDVHDGLVTTGIQSGEKNTNNNAVLEGWLLSNTPDPYDSAIEEANANIEAIKERILALNGLSALDLAFKTASELEALKAEKIVLEESMVTASINFQQLKDNQRAAIESKLEAYLQDV